MSASSQMALGAVDPSPATAFKTSANPKPTGSGDAQDSPPSFQSVMQDYHDQPDDASSNASGSSRSESKKDTKSTKRSSKDDSKESQKTSDKQDPTNAATPVTGPAQNVPVLPIQFLLSNLVTQPDQLQDPAVDAGNADASSPNETRLDTTSLDASNVDTNDSQTKESKNVVGKQDQATSANGQSLTAQSLQALSGDSGFANLMPSTDQTADQTQDKDQGTTQGLIQNNVQNGVQNNVQDKTSRKPDAERQKLDDNGASQSATNQTAAALRPTPPVEPLVAQPVPVPASSAAQEMVSKGRSQDPGLSSTIPGVEDVSADAKSQPAELAFAARLSVDTPATNGTQTASPAATQESAKPASAGQSTEVPAQMPAQAAQKYAPAVSQVQPADAREGKNQHGSQSDLPAKGDSGFASMATTPTNSSAPPTKETFSTSLSQPAAGPHEIEAPPTQASSNNDIRVKLADDRGGSTEVRFLNTGSEVKVSVRTGDSALAQTLRSGLNDLTTRLTSEGIHTEMWRPGSDSGFSQSGQQNAQHNGSQSSSHQSTDSNGSGSGNAGSRQQRQNDSQQDKPRWLQELEEFSGTTSNA